MGLGFFLFPVFLLSYAKHVLEMKLSESSVWKTKLLPSQLWSVSILKGEGTNFYSQTMGQP